MQCVPLQLFVLILVEKNLNVFYCTISLYIVVVQLLFILWGAYTVNSTLIE